MCSMVEKVPRAEKMKCHPPSATNTIYYHSTKNKNDIILSNIGI